MLNITVDAQEPKDDSLAMTLTIPASEVDRAVKNAYRTISNRYNFQGFRRGRTPRPVIDAQIGREAVLADATNDLLNDAEPLVLDELDRVPVGRLEYGDDVKPVEEHQDYVIEATMELTPTSALTSYDPVAIDMPPEEATEAEVDSQVNLLLSYQTHFHDAEEVRPVVDRDFVTVAIESVKGGERYEDENRIIHVGAGLYPEDLERELVGMQAGDVKEVTFTPKATESDPEPDEVTLKVTLKAIREQHTPELTDELAHDTFGFDDVAALREGLANEIAEDKKRRLPQIKEERALIALTERLERTDFPQSYLDDCYNELIRQVVEDLQRQGVSLELFLQSRGITAQQFMADMRSQAEEHAKQSVALDAIVAEQGIDVTEDDLKAEMEKAGVTDIEGFTKSLASDGRLPELRRTLRRSKALEWLVDTAEVTEVDEVAREAERTAEEVEEAADAVDEAIGEAVEQAEAEVPEAE